MKLTYIHHSGFLLETDQCTLLFDYVKGTLPAFPEGKPLYIFVSHSHADHYTKNIFRIALNAQHSGSASVTCILSDDIPVGDIPDELIPKTHVLRPHAKWNDDLMQVTTLKSNDAGVAYRITVAGTELFFAGDLNAWNWDGDEEDMELIRIYHEELARISGVVFDLAFLPLDPRLYDECIQGITDFFDVCGCDARVIAPMHCWGNYNVIARARAMSDTYPYMTRILPIRKEGDVFSLSADA